MNIQPADTPSGIGCRIISNCFNASIVIDGMHARELAWLFGFARAPAFEWTSLRTRGEIIISLDAPDKPTAAETVDIDLEDGHVITASNQPARLQVEPHHSLRPTLFPRSLNLCLSQQFARAGILPVHGAGLVLDGTGIMLLGGKASGKSTLVAAALATGARVVSDDWLLFGLDRQGVPTMERLRQFLMLRHGHATKSLIDRHESLSFQPSTQRPKSTLAISSNAPEFPPQHLIDQLWILRRLNPRPATTQTDQSNRGSALTAFVTHSMPILFGKRFGHEHKNLQALLAAFLPKATLLEVATGLDMVTDTAATLSRLMQLGPPRKLRTSTQETKSDPPESADQR